MPYVSDWNSLRNFRTPQWLRDMKFGIYTHWGVYSVPGCRPNGSWYPHNMYLKGTPQYEHHVKTYGDPSKFGYKEFIPMFKGEHFDPDQWAEMFKKAGAGFAGPVGEHHDGFAMWNTSYNKWNAAQMGPKRDVVEELEKAIRKQGMKFMVALHHIENWFFYPHWIKEYDVSRPEFSELYGELHDMDAEGNQKFINQTKPNKAALDMWLGKTKEVIDRFSPDALWFDFGIRYVQEDYKKEMLAYYYNEAEKKHQDVFLMFKNNDLCVGSGLIDLELGRYDRLTQNEWITDTTVDDGEGWCWLFDAQYKSPRTLIHYLIDNVSKNGYLLLNVGPTPGGEIPQEAQHILSEMGKWLEQNGEAIYGTTPWLYHGEGPTKMTTAGDFTEKEKMTYTSKDFRYTAKGGTIYAICLNWTDGEYIMERMGELYPNEVKRVTMLGSDKELDFKWSPEGLTVSAPKEKPCDYAYVLKIERKNPYSIG